MHTYEVCPLLEHTLTKFFSSRSYRGEAQCDERPPSSYPCSATHDRAQTRTRSSKRRGEKVIRDSSISLFFGHHDVTPVLTRKIKTRYIYSTPHREALQTPPHHLKKMTYSTDGPSGEAAPYGRSSLSGLMHTTFPPDIVFTNTLWILLSLCFHDRPEINKQANKQTRAYGAAWPAPHPFTRTLMNLRIAISATRQEQCVQHIKTHEKAKLL